MRKISLIGAGNIGTILAYNLSRKQIGEIILVDVVEGLAEGKCLDLAQSFPVENLNIKIEGSSDIAKIDIEKSCLNKIKKNKKKYPIKLSKGNSKKYTLLKNKIFEKNEKKNEE